MCEDHDDDEEIMPIPLDRETLKLLAEFAREAGMHPMRAASALLRDVLTDDAMAHHPQRYN